MKNNNKNIFNSSSLKGEKIMLLVGSGFIGHHLALGLRKKGADVIVLDNLQINNIVSILGNLEISDLKRKLYIKFILDRYTLMREAGIRFSNIDGRDLNY